MGETGERDKRAFCVFKMVGRENPGKKKEKQILSTRFNVNVMFWTDNAF